jgi:hypothetical protein
MFLMPDARRFFISATAKTGKAPMAFTAGNMPSACHCLNKTVSLSKSRRKMFHTHFRSSPGAFGHFRAMKSTKPANLTKREIQFRSSIPPLIGADHRALFIRNHLS